MIPKPLSDVGHPFDRQRAVLHYGAAALFLSTALLIAAIPIHAQTTVVAPTPVPTLAPIIVTSTVISGTAGVKLPTGLELTLHDFRNNSSGVAQETSTQTLTLLADGKLHFAPFLAELGDIVVITTQYQGTTQGSAPVVLSSPTDNQIDMPVTLYAATNDASALQINHDDQVINFLSGNLMSVVETIEWTIKGDRLYFSADKTSAGTPISVSVPLPVGARAVAFNSQPTSRFIVGGDANAPIVNDTAPVIPGITHQMVFSYQIPYPSGAYIDRTYPYATSGIQVLIPDDTGVKLAGQQGAKFDSAPNTTLNPQRAYTTFTLTSPVPAQGRVVYTLSGAPGTFNNVTTAQTVPAKPPPVDLGLGGVLIVIGLLVVVIAVLWILRRWTLNRSRVRRSPR